MHGSQYVEANVWNWKSVCESQCVKVIVWKLMKVSSHKSMSGSRTPSLAFGFCL